MFWDFLAVAFITICIEWLTVFVMTKTKLVDKFLPKQDASKSFLQFKAGGMDAHFEGNMIDAINQIKGFFFPDQSVDDRIDNRINEAIDKNTDKLIGLMLTDKNIQKQIQKQIFTKIKQRLEADKHNDKK